jgi:hypothetical protein
MTDDERAGSLLRHPSRRGYRPAVAVLTARFAIELAEAGAPFPESAAAAVAARAASGLGVAAFASASGLSVADVERLERDGCLPGDVPGPIPWRGQGLA